MSPGAAGASDRVAAGIMVKGPVYTSPNMVFTIGDLTNAVSSSVNLAWSRVLFN